MANDSVATTMARMVEASAKKMYRGSVTLSDVVGISDEELEALYGVGYHLFNWGKYQPALDIFSVLTLYSPFKGHYRAVLRETQLGGVHNLDIGSACTMYCQPQSLLIFGADGALLFAPQGGA